MKKIIFIMIFTIAFISIPNTNSANINMGIGASINKTGYETGIKKQATIKSIVIDNETKVENVRPGLVTKKATSLNKRLSVHSIPAEKRDRLFGLLLLAYGGKR
jgi:hypothetical protein